MKKKQPTTLEEALISIKKLEASLERQKSKTNRFHELWTHAVNGYKKSFNEASYWSKEALANLKQSSKYEKLYFELLYRTVEKLYQLPDSQTKDDETTIFDDVLWQKIKTGGAIVDDPRDNSFKYIFVKVDNDNGYKHPSLTEYLHTFIDTHTI